MPWPASAAAGPTARPSIPTERAGARSPVEEVLDVLRVARARALLRARRVARGLVLARRAALRGALLAPAASAATARAASALALLSALRRLLAVGARLAARLALRRRRLGAGLGDCVRLAASMPCSAAPTAATTPPAPAAALAPAVTVRATGIA